MTNFDIIGFIGSAWLGCYATMYYVSVIKPRFLQILDLFYEDDSVGDDEPVRYAKKNELIV